MMSNRKPAERCQVDHLHWHRLRHWQVHATIALLGLWVATCVVVATHHWHWWINYPAMVVLYAAAYVMLLHSIRRVP
jgi:hypothetical protein